jgi:hypothetical protein
MEQASSTEDNSTVMQRLNANTADSRSSLPGVEQASMAGHSSTLGRRVPGCKCAVCASVLARHGQLGAAAIESTCERQTVRAGTWC